ncbi:hypothetical protein KY359_00910, partial [Candidatus Woesearchaeota archaeon]|nr:hypothetical protein [Candidatus Woesearchaeota archaeon]
ESLWNDPLDIHAEVRIFDSKKSVSSKTSTNLLQPWKTLELESFIDTSELEDKEYDVQITVFFAEKKVSLDGKVKLVAPPPGASEVEAPVKEEATPEKAGLSATTLTIILVAVVVLLTVINVFLALYRKKKE